MSAAVCVFNIVMVVNCRTTLFLWCSHNLGSKNENALLRSVVCFQLDVGAH